MDIEKIIREVLRETDRKDDSLIKEYRVKNNEATVVFWADTEDTINTVYYTFMEDGRWERSSSEYGAASEIGDAVSRRIRKVREERLAEYVCKAIEECDRKPDQYVVRGDMVRLEYDGETEEICFNSSWRSCSYYGSDNESVVSWARQIGRHVKEEVRNEISKQNRYSLVLLKAVRKAVKRFDKCVVENYSVAGDRVDFALQRINGKYSRSISMRFPQNGAPQIYMPGTDFTAEALAALIRSILVHEPQIPKVDNRILAKAVFMSMARLDEEEMPRKFKLSGSKMEISYKKVKAGLSFDQDGHYSTCMENVNQSTKEKDRIIRIGDMVGELIRQRIN